MASEKPISVIYILLSILFGGIAYVLFILPTGSLSSTVFTVLQLLRNTILFIFLYFLFEKSFSMELYTKILVGLILGTVAGLLLHQSIVEFKPVGTAFIRLIQMVVMPLVFASLFIGTASLGDIGKMGRIGGKTLIFYLLYTAFAVGVGLVLANLFQPGSGLPEHIKTALMQNYSSQAGSKVTSAAKPSIVDTFLNIIPTNPFSALSQGVLLQIIFFAIFGGAVATMIPPEKGKLLVDFMDAVNDLMIKTVHIVIKVAPYGVFALIASVIGSFGMEILVSLLKYSLLTIAGLLLLNFTYPFVVSTLGGMKPMQFLKGILPAQLVAFSTSSSSATLPVTIEVSETNLGVPNDIASFVLPLGATINMNGTALYQGISALFIAQVYGMHLTIGNQLIIVLTATLASVGTAGAPGVGMLMLVIVLKQIGIPLEGIALILGVERILDMFRTTINITGDTAAAVVVAASEGELKIPSGEKS